MRSPAKAFVCQCVIALFGLTACRTCAASATDFWITQNGAGSANGSSLENAASCGGTGQSACAAFNKPSNWGSGPGQIGPGTTIHVSGTITAAANAANYFAFQAGGASGSPITFLMDSTTVITSPAWASGAGAIYSTGHNYITINGGATGNAAGGTFAGGGVIQATQNGSGLAYQNTSGGINVYGCSNCTFENMIISNIYVHNSLTDGSGDPTGAIYVQSGSDVLITNNVAHDMKWCIEYAFGNGDTNVTMSNNLVYNVDHGFVIQTGGTGAAFTNGYIFGNVYRDPANWDDNGNHHHHDGVHMWATGAGNSLTNSFVYNNLFYGNFGVHMNSAVYQEAIGYSLPCNAWVFNNVISPNAGTAGNGYLGLGANGGTGCWNAVNNTIVGYSTSAASALNFNGTAGTAYNNIISTVYSADGITAAPAAIDYQDYYNLGSGGLTGGGASLAVWVTYCEAIFTGTVGCDAHSTSGNPNVTAAFIPKPGSPAIQAGKNLYSTCNGQPTPGLGALCYDAAGTPRSSTGAWGIGAYEHIASPSLLGVIAQ